MSLDCIQNVDNSQAETLLEPDQLNASRLRAPHPLVGHMGDQRSHEASPKVIRISTSGWRVARGPQPLASRRTIAATSSSGTPTGHTAATAARSGPAEVAASSDRSADASARRA